MNLVITGEEEHDYITCDNFVLKISFADSSSVSSRSSSRTSRTAEVDT